MVGRKPLYKDTVRVVAVLGAAWLGTLTADAVQDGLGTNYVGVLRASGVELDGEVRTTWPVERSLAVGGTVDFRGKSNHVFWAASFAGEGTLTTARVQTDEGTAEIRIVRAAWNDDWNTYTEVNSLSATTTGVADSTWSSTWMSNTYRLGVVVTEYTSGTSLWWSVEVTP
jgi:hypothetical protein